MSKKVKQPSQPPARKFPRIDPSITDPMKKYPGWHLEIIDIEGPWSWMQINKDSFITQILPKVKHFEKMIWREILNKNNHEISQADICSKAQRRLRDLNLDDIESLVSLRLTGKQRIWGTRAMPYGRNRRWIYYSGN